MPGSIQTESAQSPSGKIFQEAFERRLAAAEAIPDSELLSLNVDIGAAVSTVLGVLPGLLAMREQMVLLPGFVIAHLDHLADQARGLAHAHSLYQSATTPAVNLPQLNAEAMRLRQMLMSDAMALATRGLIDGELLSEFKGLTGYKNLGMDLLRLVTLLRGAWPRIATRTALTLEELDHAEQVADGLLVGAGEKARPASPQEQAAARLRLQWFTLFSRSYDQMRRAVTFLRWDQGDADQIAPSLYARQGSHGYGKGEQEQKDAGEGTAAPAEPAAPGAAAPAAPAAPVGMPGSSPFLKLDRAMAALFLGSGLPLDGAGQEARYLLPPSHLITHGVVVGMTGSGKTGLLTVACEEALRAQIPVLMLDVKGDLPNLLLAFPSFDAAHLRPWAATSAGPDDTRTPEQIAAELSSLRRSSLTGWGLDEGALAAFCAGTGIRVLTPGSSAGEPVHVLSSLERRSTLWETDPESARTTLCAAISLVLRLLRRDPDPARSREHVLLSVLAERRLLAGQNADLASLLEDLEKPPITQVGALSLDKFLPRSERRALAAALNTLLASPTFAAWRQGASLDVAEWLTPREGKTPAVIVSVAHLDDEERSLVLGMFLEELLGWVRSLPGSQRLRALVVFDEVFGFLPPHPANPPTKRPLVALMKQARAFGVGVVVATQNPMDLDYRALSNAGWWCVGRLQTDADRERVVEAMAGHDREESRSLHETLSMLAPRWFVVRDTHTDDGLRLLQPRWAMSFLRGPMTRAELRRAREAWGRHGGGL